jgi:3-oxoacyl-[acyl-carrier protein] reductase
MSVGTLLGRVAVVTGGSSGIGQATCVALSRSGADVVVVGRNRERVAATVEQAKAASGAAGMAGTIVGMPDVDVRDEVALERVVRETVARLGGVDILVCSAGIGRSASDTGFAVSPVSTLASRVWDEIVDTNLKGHFLAARAAFPAMIARGGGEIVCISSSPGGLRGQPYAAAYCASKFGVMGLAEALAVEGEAHGIRVHVLVPDAVDTPLIRGTRLVRRGVLPASVVGDFIVDLLQLPDDTTLLHPRIAASRPDGSPSAGNPVGPLRRGVSR